MYEIHTEHLEQLQVTESENTVQSYSQSGLLSMPTSGVKNIKQEEYRIQRRSKTSFAFLTFTVVLRGHGQSMWPGHIEVF